MGRITVDQLKEGMIIAEDVKDISSRLLIKKGQSIQPKHFKILKMWGITEVSIADDGEKAKRIDIPLDQKDVQRLTIQVKKLFKYNDISHPVIKEIFIQSVIHRSRHKVKITDDLPIIDRNMATLKVDKKKLESKILKADMKLPEIPSIVFELNEIIANPTASTNDIAQIVNKSPSLSAVLLRMVNSAFYGFPSKIDSISRAVTIIGTREISALALGISTMKMFRDIPKEIIDMHTLLKHCLLCGIMSRIFGAHKNIRQTEQLFIAGLLHDVGRLVMYKFFPEMTQIALSLAQSQNQRLYDTEKSILGLRHTDIAHLLLKKWKLPLNLEEMVTFHHRPLNSSQPLHASIIHLSDFIINAFGLGKSGEFYIPKLNEEAFESLDIAFPLIKTVIEQTLHQYSHIEPFFKDQE